MAKITNTFNQGIDRDSSKNKYDTFHYYDARNVRLLSQDELSSGALENMKGNVYRLDVNTYGDIVGDCVVGDFLVLWTTTNTSTPTGATTDRIWKIPIASLDALAGGTVYSVSATYYHLGGDLVYSGNLWLSTENPIKCIPRYENENVQKAYWVDGYNNLRHINTVFDADINDLVNLTEDKLEVIGDIELSRPELEEIVSGNITAGRVQYVYQLYNTGGTETVYSPASSLISLTSTSETLGNTEAYKGTDISINTGKGVKMSVLINTAGYSRMRIVAIHYTSLNGDPEIRVVDEKTITGAAAETIFFTDTGTSLENLLLEDIRLLGTFLFVPNDLETKDNILIPANITEQSWDVDYDARAYRFGGLSAISGEYNYNSDATRRQISQVYQENGWYYKINGSTGATTYHDAGGVLQDTLADWTEIPETADCINPFNDLDNDGVHSERYMYQSDGETIGGEGENIKYNFEVVRKTIDEDVADARRFYTTVEGTAANPSYHGYASPYVSNDFVGYTRDEIYRFGIVLFDDKGRSSFVKWIGDVRMPSNSTRALAAQPLSTGLWVFDIGANDGAGAYADVLYVQFEVSNLPGNVDSYQIVRVKRGDNDRTVKAQGLVSDFSEAGGTLLHSPWATAGAGNGVGFHCFHSPEVSFNKDLSVLSTDKLQAISGTATALTHAGGAGTSVRAYKYQNWAYMTNPQLPASAAAVADTEHANQQTAITEGFVVTQDGGTRDIGGYSYDPNNATTKTDKGINFLFQATNASWRGSTVTTLGRQVVNYRRNLYASQYNGISYSARTRNTYIPASNIVDDGTSTVDCYGGDTYIAYFDCLVSSWQQSPLYDWDATYPIPEVVHFPVETSINLPLRIDDCFHREYLATDVQLIHDIAGEYADDGGVPLSYTQERDLYVYNTAYSKENDSMLFIPQPVDWNAETTFKTRILASEPKITNEVSDSWLKYPVNQFIDVDPQFGEITAVKTINEQMLFFQPKAFGTVSINERALIQTGTTSQLSLGVSGVLERYDYAKTGMGLMDKKHMVLTPNALYWVDFINEAMYKFTGGPEELSTMKGLDAWFRSNIINQTDMLVYHDPQYREVYLTDNNAGWTIMYNEMTDGFVCFTDFVPTYAINYNDTLLTTTNGGQFFRHNDVAATRGSFYGSVFSSYITLLVNPDNEGIATFNNMEWLTEVLDASGDDLQETFDSIRFWNDYQSTGAANTDLTVNSNVKRRMRKWRYTLPRAAYKGDHTTSLDRRDARFRDSHLFAKLTFINRAGANDRKLVAHDIITSFSPSNI